jgi:hypothetical protein
MSVRCPDESFQHGRRHVGKYAGGQCDVYVNLCKYGLKSIIMQTAQTKVLLSNVTLFRYLLVSLSLVSLSTSDDPSPRKELLWDTAQAASGGRESLPDPEDHT